MNVRQTEQQQNTPEQVAEYLATALAIVDESDIPADLVPVVLPEVMRLVASKQIFYEQVAAGLDLSGLNRH